MYSLFFFYHFLHFHPFVYLIPLSRFAFSPPPLCFFYYWFLQLLFSNCLLNKWMNKKKKVCIRMFSNSLSLFLPRKGTEICRQLLHNNILDSIQNNHRRFDINTFSPIKKLTFCQYFVMFYEMCHFPLVKKKHYYFFYQDLFSAVVLRPSWGSEREHGKIMTNNITHHVSN